MNQKGITVRSPLPSLAYKSSFRISEFPALALQTTAQWGQGHFPCKSITWLSL